MEFARYDLARAAEVAREISAVGWQETTFAPSGTVDDHGVPSLSDTVYADTSSVLAEVAHRYLDQGNYQAADRILSELTDRSGDIEGLTGTTAISICYAKQRAPAVGRVPQFEGYPEHPIGEPRPVRQHTIEGAGAIFNLSQDWSTCAKRYFYRDPADVVRAVRAVAQGPYSLARTIRVIAEYEATADLARATSLIRAITDPGERAIGLAGLHQAAHTPDYGHGSAAEALSRELDRALAELEPYRWFADTGMEDADTRAWAYARPDHQVRFEVAVRAYGCRSQDMKAIRDLTILKYAMFRSMMTWLSRCFATEYIAGKRPHPSFAETHQELLQAADGNWLLDIARAQAAYHDFRISVAVPSYRSSAARVRIADPRYGAVVDLVTPKPGEPLSPEFKAKIDDMIKKGQLPAAAGLVAFAADARPEYATDLCELGNQIIEAVGHKDPAWRADTLSRLVEAPSLRRLVDPAALYSETERSAPHGWETWALSDVRNRLFPVLVMEDPGAALRVLYGTAATSWGDTMGLLEAAAGPLTGLTGIEAPVALADAIRRGLACMAPGDTIPPVVDGVRLGRLSDSTREGRL